MELKHKDMRFTLLAAITPSLLMGLGILVHGWFGYRSDQEVMLIAEKHHKEEMMAYKEQTFQRTQYSRRS
jgi:hypothetical protein